MNFSGTVFSIAKSETDDLWKILSKISIQMEEYFKLKNHKISLVLQVQIGIFRRSRSLKFVLS